MRRCTQQCFLASFLMLTFYTTRIWGGTLAKQADTTHQVSLRKFEDEESFGKKHMCGGSLISPNVVLTSSHCFRYTKPPDVKVVMGNVDRFDKSNTLSFSIENVTTHTLQAENDITLVYLKGSVPSNVTHIRPIKINRKRIEYGVICQVTGWGPNECNTEQEKLLTVDIPVVDCSKTDVPEEFVSPGMMCAGYINVDGKCACHGDSGGPLVCNGLLAGVIAKAYKGTCGMSRLPAVHVYMNVSYYQKWIEQHVEEIREISEEGSAKLNNSQPDLPRVITNGSFVVSSQTSLIVFWIWVVSRLK